MRVPANISMGNGVRIRKFIQGGVIRPRFSGRAKKPNACESGLRIHCSRSSRYVFMPSPPRSHAGSQIESYVEAAPNHDGTTSPPLPSRRAARAIPDSIPRNTAACSR
jgi:hypothetical protein